MVRHGLDAGDTGGLETPREGLHTGAHRIGNHLLHIRYIIGYYDIGNFLILKCL